MYLIQKNKKLESISNEFTKNNKLTRRLSLADDTATRKSTEMDLDIKIILTKPNMYRSWITYVSNTNSTYTNGTSHFSTFASHLARFVSQFKFCTDRKKILYPFLPH